MPHTLDLKKLKKDIHLPGDQKEEEREEMPLLAEHRAEEKAAHLVWTAPEYDYFPKEVWWFVVLGIVTIALALGALLLKNYLFAAFVIIAGSVVAMFASREPKRVHFAITGEGIQIDTRFYPFRDLRSFWIFNDPPLLQEVSIESKKAVMPYIRAPLGEASPEKVREVLRRFLPEEKQDESFLALLSRAVRF